MHDFAGPEIVIPGVDAGIHRHRHLQSCPALFPRDALLVLLYEELLRDPARELGRLTAFLGLDMVEQAAQLADVVLPRRRRAASLMPGAVPKLVASHGAEPRGKPPAGARQLR
jgi:hypothetical protein